MPARFDHAKAAIARLDDVLISECWRSYKRDRRGSDQALCLGEDAGEPRPPGQRVRAQLDKLATRYRESLQSRASDLKEIIRESANDLAVLTSPFHLRESTLYSLRNFLEEYLASLRCRTDSSKSSELPLQVPLSRALGPAEVFKLEQYLAILRTKGHAPPPDQLTKSLAILVLLDKSISELSTSSISVSTVLVNMSRRLNLAHGAPVAANPSSALATAHDLHSIPTTLYSALASVLTPLLPDTPSLTCPICLYPFHDPVTLRCQHTFCMHCISTYHKMVSATSSYLAWWVHYEDRVTAQPQPCPLCRAPFNLRSEFWWRRDAALGNVVKAWFPREVREKERRDRAEERRRRRRSAAERWKWETVWWAEGVWDGVRENVGKARRAVVGNIRGV